MSPYAARAPRRGARAAYVRGLGLTFAALGSAWALTGCSSVDLPDRDDPAVQREEARVVQILEKGSPRTMQPSRCKVRLLGQDSGQSFVWAECTQTVSPETAYSVPARIRGEQVTMPQDGDRYASSVRDMFPAELADLVLDDPDQARP